jgi:hypothetical protein
MAAAANLLFEWPLDSAQHIVDEWFQGFVIEIEGYISRRSCLGELAKLFFQPYNASTIRELLRGLSDKLPEEELRKRLIDQDLDATIKTAIEERR